MLLTSRLLLAMRCHTPYPSCPQDGVQLQVGPERFAIPELLMDPSVVEKEFSPIPDSLPKVR